MENEAFIEREHDFSSEKLISRVYKFFFVCLFFGLSSQAKGGEIKITSESLLEQRVVISDAEKSLDVVSHILEENP